MKTPASTPTATCACADHQLCLVCAPPELTTMIQLKMSLHWAQSPAELRERVGAREHLVATAQNN